MNGYLVSTEEEIGIINSLQVIYHIPVHSHTCSHRTQHLISWVLFVAVFIQKYFEEHRVVDGAFMQGLHALYDIEIVSEEAIFAWEEALRQSDRPERRFLQQVSILFALYTTLQTQMLRLRCNNVLSTSLSLSLCVCVL